MSLEARYQHHSQSTIDLLQNLEELEQVAAAAGHGYSRIGREFNAGWVELTLDPENVRPSYDMRFIRTFSPDVIKALLFELNEARIKLADYQEPDRYEQTGE